MQTSKTITRYFTFGQSHRHDLPNGTTLDKDTILVITAEDPTEVMFSNFGPEWAFQYESCPDLQYFPKGIKTL